MPILASRRITLISLTSSFRSPLSLQRHFFLRFFSNKMAMDRINNDSAKSSLPEPLPGNGESVDANVIPDNPLSNIFHDNEKYFMVGTIPVLLNRNTKKNSLLLSTSPRCMSSDTKRPELMSSCDHLPSTPTSTVSEKRKFKRICCLDLGFGQGNGNNSSESSFCSSSDDNNSNISTTKTLSLAAKFNRHRKESPKPSHFFKMDDAASANKRYNHRQRKINHDICFHGKRNFDLIGSPLLEQNMENCSEMQEGGINDRILRPGMVLLKHHLTHDEQVEIVKNCRNLGLGPGGFYQPGYADGAKLRLTMMCLGMDWDPQTRKYGYKRVVDGSKPPSIPNFFSKLVIRALQEAHRLINQECEISYVEDILPSMTPDICIVNFYTTRGRLGLHQDRDESRESLQKGLPVVSFSVGDTAEFLYGDNRNIEKAENALLESGDVLIFGGESRHVFHGISSIIPNSAPNELLHDTCLCPGRLNLTFRQY